MTLYFLCVALHLLAVTLWIGHMLFWSLFVGPVTKRIEPPETGEFLQKLSVRKGGLGWPALVVLVATGIYILSYKGLTWHALVSGEIFRTPYGYVLSAKLFFVAGMIAYQLFVGHRPAPKLIYADMLAAFCTIALSIVLARVVAVGNPYWDFKLPQPYLKRADHQLGPKGKYPESLGNVKIIVKSPTIWNIVSPDAQLERLASGFQFIEGPVFDHEKGCLLFSDIRANKIYRWTPGEGVSVYRAPSGNANGLAFDQAGRVIAAEHLNRRISRTLADGSVVALATHFKGKRLNSPNDLVIKSDGSIYFTDPPYGLNSPKAQELDYQGVFRIAPHDNSLDLLTDDLARPNGLAFSADEKTLYVSDQEEKNLMAFSIKEDNTLEGGTVFARIYGDRGAADGVKIDSQNNVYMTGPGGIWIWDQDGRELGVIATPEVAANMNWGDQDRQSLYITASTSLYRIRLNIPGSPSK
ncbi:MAG: SMP-30/gluconolactonase/LRE family protein [Desulfobacterales bacterium]|nr:MAG: SMP-30/gluconolactonase/LRE family protein [Desulfobacterales bacterium]